MTAAESPAGFRVKGFHVLAGVVAFFAVVIAVNAVFLMQAIRTFPGEVSITPYEDGLAYNREIALRAAQAQLGWTAAVAIKADAVAVTVRGPDGEPVSGLVAQGLLQRPATEEGRRELVFTEPQAGRYVASADALSGAWDLTFSATDEANRHFSAQRRLTWR